MDINHNDYFPKSTPTPEQKHQKREKHRYSFGFVFVFVAFAVVLSTIVTYTFTSASERAYYTAQLKEQQKLIEQLKADNGTATETDFEKLEVLAALIERYSYYTGKVSDEELLNAVLKAYASATGDDYAEYYTEEEYQTMINENAGAREGIGVSVIQTMVTVDGYDYQVFQIIAIFEDGPSASSALRVGDCIYSIKDGDTYKTVAALGGFTKAITYIQGESGTQAEFAVLRRQNESYVSIPFSISRGSYESVSVSGFFSEADPSVGIVRINNFDLTTPNQFKAAVKRLQSKGATKFVFDVRNNPGGDLQSIKAVLTYFLQEGDLILAAIDKNEKVAASYVAEPMTFFDDYASCNVSPSDIGMFADLDTVVLCNGNTASAAEVFAATLRDYGLAEIVGETTFGKGIMQSFIPLSKFGKYSGYIKMTTYAYVTKCGITYHEIGIAPTDGIETPLSDEALQYNFYVLPQAKDDQLAAALAKLQ